jgi:hypothetical protein
MFISYSHLVLVFLSAVVALLTILLLCRRRSSATTLIFDRPGFEDDYFLPVLVHEIRYPSFGKILSLVFNQFGAERYLSDPEFRDAFEALRASAFEKRHPRKVISDMSLIVRAFLRDPDVECQFREELPPLVDLFLAEIQSGTAGPTSSSD